MMIGEPWPGDPAYLKAAFSKLGLSEIAGPRNEKQVLEMYAACGHSEIHDDETAWCAAFVGWCLRQAGLPNTGSLLAHSYASYGTKAATPGNRVPRGAICVWTRTGGNHVNFCLADDGVYLTCIGGNQENGKGGGVTVSKRSKNTGLIATVIPPVAVRPPPDIEPTIKPPAKPPVAPRVVAGGVVGAALLAVWKFIGDYPVPTLCGVAIAVALTVYLLKRK